MINDTQRALVVTIAYRRLVMEMTGRFVHVPSPRYGTVSMNNLVEFYHNALIKGVSVAELMEASFNAYSKLWLERTFGNPYPPLALAVSEGTRNKALKNVSVKPKIEPMQSHIERYMAMLSTFDKPTALELVNSGGFCGGREDIRDALIKELSK